MPELRAALAISMARLCDTMHPAPDKACGNPFPLCVPFHPERWVILLPCRSLSLKRIISVPTRNNYELDQTNLWEEGHPVTLKQPPILHLKNRPLALLTL